MEELQIRFNNATDMKERAKIRIAIQNLRMEQECLPSDSPLSRQSLRRSRRFKSVSPDEKTAATHTDQSSKAAVSVDSESVFENGDKTQSFVRNSSVRRNRRSRSSRTSKSSDHNSEHKLNAIDARNLKETEYSGDKFPNTGTNEIKNSWSPVQSRVTHTEREDGDHKSQVTSDVTIRRPVKKEYIGNNNEEQSRTPNDNTVELTQGATCQYKTINTSFRGPTWNPVSTPNRSSTHRHSHQTHRLSYHTQSANNNNNKQEWIHNRVTRSAYTPETVYSGGEVDSPKSHHQKHSARVVLKALSKKLFSAKPKLQAASGHQIPSTPTVKPTSGISQFFPAALSTPESNSTSYPTTSSRPSRPSPFQERKKVFERNINGSNPAWEKVPTHQFRSSNKSCNMADVLSRPDTGSPHHVPDVASSEDEDAVEELESLLKQYKDYDKRVKIRETIRLLKESLREDDNSPSGSPTSTDNQPPRSGSSPTTHKSVLTFTASNNSPPRNTQENTSFTVSIQKPSPSRFIGRSTSLRTSKPSYKPPTEAIHRASSFKLSRPKDFVLKKVDSSPQLAKVSEEFRDYADTLNNNVPTYKTEDSDTTVSPSSLSHNKTASPFSASSKSSFRKTAWTPPSPPKSTLNTSSVTSVHTLQVTSLRRSESTKENRSANFQPIPIVRGNVRRSKSILGRILGHKIGLEKEPFIATVTPSILAKEKPSILSPKEIPTTEPSKNFEPVPDSIKTLDLSDSESCLSEDSSSSSSISEKEHVYELDSETDSEYEHQSATLSEIVQATKRQIDNETLSVSQTVESSEILNSESENCDENAEVESEFVFEKKTVTKIVNKPLYNSETVTSIETVELLNVEIISPVLRGNLQTQYKETENILTKSKNQEHKETRLLSSSSDSSAELSDDEDSSPEEANMDRYSSRALQSRVSVKSQILATEDDKSVKSPRRLRERGNKPLNTGDDVKSRIQRFRGQLDSGEVDKNAPTAKQNGGVKVPGASGKKIDVSKFETDPENVKVATTASGNTTVTLTTGGPKSTARSTSREEKHNGFSTASSVDSEHKRENSSSSSATDDSSRPRRTRRTKISEKENGIEKFEKAAEITTSELKYSSSNKNISPELTITTKRNREVAIKEDVNNNNTKSDKALAPSSDDVGVIIEDSLSSWSSRRRKKREKKLESSNPTSGTEENEKSSEDNSGVKENEPEVIPTIKHVAHSEPALSDMSASLHGYNVKLSSKGPSGPKDEVDGIKEEQTETAARKSSRVRGRYSRSSETRSSTSSGNDVIESTKDLSDNDGLVLGLDTRAEMEVEPTEVNAIADDEIVIQSEIVENLERENVKERESEEECEENTETAVANDVEDNEETNKVNKVESENESADVTSPADDTVTKSEEIVEPKKNEDNITENNDDSVKEQDIQPTQTNDIDVEQTIDKVYKEEVEVDEIKNDAQQEVVITPIESDTKNAGDATETETVDGQAVETTEKPINEKEHKKRHKETKEISEDSEKPKRRHHRKKDKTSDEKTTEDDTPKRRRHRKKSHQDEKVEAEKKVEEAKTAEKKTRKSKEKEIEKSKAELPKEEIKKEKSIEVEEKKETPKTEEIKEKKEEPPKEMHFSYDNVEEITDLNLLEKMLYASEEYDQRRRIRSVIRALRKGVKPTPVQDTDWKSKGNGTALALKSNENQKVSSPSPGDLAFKSSLHRGGAKESRVASSKMAFTKLEKTDLGSKYTSIITEKKTMTSGQKKIGSVFDRGGDDDDDRKSSRTSGSSRYADLERRQADRKRELQRNRSMPASSSKDARKAFVAKLEASAPKTQGKKVGRSPTFVVPNANNIKQLLLKWCQSKTRGYEHVDIMNFSGSWASGMAFCALTHNFFPEAFDYDKLDPKNRAENFDLAFKSADTHGDIPQLLDTEDMIRMREPDWKCVYTYIGEFYKRIRDLGLN